MSAKLTEIITLAFEIGLAALVVVMGMLFLRGKHEILGAIICLVMVNMMYYFVRQKISSENFLHYKTMFKYISIAISVRMIKSLNGNVAVSVSFAFPEMMSGARIISSFYWLSHMPKEYHKILGVSSALYR